LRRKIRDHVAGVVGVMVAETPTGPVSPGFAVHRPHRLRVAAARGTGVGVRMFPPSAVTTAHSRRCRWVGQLRSTTAPRGREGIPMITTADAPHVLFRRVLITPLLPVDSAGAARGAGSIRDGHTERQHSAECDYGSKGALLLAGTRIRDSRLRAQNDKRSVQYVWVAPRGWPGGRRCVGKYAVSGRILWIRWALRNRLLVGGGLG